MDPGGYGAGGPGTPCPGAPSGTTAIQVRGRVSPAPPGNPGDLGKGMQRGRSVEHLEADDAADDAEEHEDLERGGRFAVEDHGVGHGQHGANADPDGVGGADGEGAHGPGEPGHAEDEPADEDEGGCEFGEAVALAERGGPDGFHDAGEDKHDPCHERPPIAPSCRRPGTAHLVRVPGGCLQYPMPGIAGPTE